MYTNMYTCSQKAQTIETTQFSSIKLKAVGTRLSETRDREDTHQKEEID